MRERTFECEERLYVRVVLREKSCTRGRLSVGAVVREGEVMHEERSYVRGRSCVRVLMLGNRIFVGDLDLRRLKKWYLPESTFPLDGGLHLPFLCS